MESNIHGPHADSARVFGSSASSWDAGLISKDIGLVVYSLSNVYTCLLLLQGQ